MAEKEKGQLGLETELCVGVGVKSVTEKRVVKLTAKALLEKISALEKERKSKFSKLSNAKTSIAKLMGDKEHVSEVEMNLTCSISCVTRYSMYIHLYWVYCLLMTQTNMRYGTKLKC